MWLSRSLCVGLVLQTSVPGSRTFDTLRLGERQVLNLVIFMGPLTVKIELSLYLAVLFKTVLLSGETAVC